MNCTGYPAIYDEDYPCPFTHPCSECWWDCEFDIRRGEQE